MGGRHVFINSEKEFWVAAIPAVFMTWNIFTYILSQKIGLGLDLNLSYIIAFVLTILWVAYFSYQYKKITAGAQFELDHPIPYQQQQVT